MALTKINTNGVSDSAITSAKIDDGSITNDDIKSDAAITAGKLSATLDLSSKTITLPAASVTAHATTATPTTVSDTSNASTGAFDVPAGTTAQRPVSPSTGNIRYNSTILSMELWNGVEWLSYAKPNPEITSISPTTASTTGTTVTITGTNFITGAAILLIGNDGTEYTPSSSSFVNGTSYTFVTPALPVANEPYDIKLTDANNGTVTSLNILDAGGSPTWTTASGSLGSITENATGTHATVVASDPDGDTVTYAVTTGSLPPGLSLNTTTGVISGDPTDVSSDTTSNFTITASDGTNTSARAFSMTVTDFFLGATSGNPGTSCQAIYDAGITSSATYWIKPGSTAAVQAHCNGGWTLVVRMNNQGSNSQNTTSAYNGVPTPSGNTAKLSHTLIQELVNTSSYTNPNRVDFCSGVTRYINGGFTWTSSSNRNLGASWTTSTSSTSYATHCGSGSSPNLNNGNGGEWASNSISWPFMDGTCAYNGGFSTGGNCCGGGNGDAWGNAGAWSSSTGCSTTGRSTMNIWIGG